MEEATRKRRVVTEALLALLIEEEEDAGSTRDFEDDLNLLKSAYAEEDRVQEATLEERLQMVPAANDEMSDLEYQRLRRFAHCSMAMGAAMETQEPVPTQPTKSKKLWSRRRSQAWWKECADPSFPAEEFRQLFRISRETFCHICDNIGALVIRQNTKIRAPVPVQQRVASGLWRLASADALYLVSQRFGLGVSTCQKNSLDMCTALNSVMLPEHVQWPSGEYLETVSHAFEQICGVPKVAGVLYTTHISICAPSSALAEYHNKRHTERFKRTSYSMTIQATVDHRGLFTNLCLGWPGSMTDEKILEKSALSQRANQGALQGHWVIAGRSVPLQDWLLVPYPECPDMPWMQRNFNERLGEAIAVAKGAFTRLKARWRFLTKRTESKLVDLPSIFGACCVLHNICERRGEVFDPAWGQEVFDEFVAATREDEESPYAMHERDKIAHMLCAEEGYYDGGQPDGMDDQGLAWA